MEQQSKSSQQLIDENSQSEIDVAVANFLKFLIKQKQVKMAPQSIERFKSIWNKNNGIVEAEVISREKLDSKLVDKLKSFLRNKYQAREIALKNIVKPEIKGGVIIRAKDEILDSSLSNKLKKLKDALTK